MEHLFGDSTPFPHPFDFLHTLEAFVTRATKVVHLQHQADELAEKTVRARADRAAGLESLAKFHATAVRALRKLNPEHGYSTVYSERLRELAAGLVAEQRAIVKDADEHAVATLGKARARAAQETASQLSTFFQIAEMPTLSTSFTMKLRDGKPEVRASRVFASGIAASFVLGTTHDATWGAPRKIVEIFGALTLVVGIKKSWLGSKVTREPAKLDELVLGGVELDADQTKLFLRKKLESPDHLVLTLRREGDVASGRVENPGDPNAAEVSPELGAEDLVPLERLVASLRASLEPLVAARVELTELTLDGQPVFQENLARGLIQRVVAILAPTALEVAKRSPNAQELSLKREAAGGKREEVYLKRSVLLGALQPVPSAVREVFTPLGFDEWEATPPEASAARAPEAPSVSAPETPVARAPDEPAPVARSPEPTLDDLDLQAEVVTAEMKVYEGGSNAQALATALPNVDPKAEALHESSGPPAKPPSVPPPFPPAAVGPLPPAVAPPQKPPSIAPPALPTSGSARPPPLPPPSLPPMPMVPLAAPLPPPRPPPRRTASGQVPAVALPAPEPEKPEDPLRISPLDLQEDV